MESVYIAIFSTFAITCAVCYKVFALRMAKRLKEQEQHYHQRTADLLNRLHHAGQIKAGASLAGLTGITLWALRNCITQFVKHFDAKDWNTREPISELQQITDNEFSAILKITNEFLSEARGILKEYDKDQGL